MHNAGPSAAITAAISTAHVLRVRNARTISVYALRTARAKPVETMVAVEAAANVQQGRDAMRATVCARIPAAVKAKSVEMTVVVEFADRGVVWARVAQMTDSVSRAHAASPTRHPVATFQKWKNACATPTRTAATLKEAGTHSVFLRRH